MKYTIFMGSPRADGNTAALLRSFLEENQDLGVEQEVLRLYDMKLNPCLGCKSCQNVPDYPGCVQEDDFLSLYETVRASDILVFATPIYAWYCTAPMKAFLDRLIYCGCKKYGREIQPSSLAGTKVAALVTCGYPIEKGADLWEDGLKRICRHTGMDYLGQFCHRDIGVAETFMNEAIEEEVRSFARTLYKQAETDR